MKFSLTKMIAAAAVVGLILLVAGCKDDGPSSEVFVKDGVNKGPRIAVLPFDAVGNIRSQDAGRVVTNTVITYLLSTGMFDVVDPGALDEALVSNQIRFTEGLRKTDLATLQKTLNLDGVVIGLVEEYGDVRVGNDSYPSVSFSTRLVNARTGSIVWAGTISKTGADKVSIFDIGRISSMGKLCKAAVQDMAASLAKTQDKLISALTPPQGDSQQIVQVPDHGLTAVTEPGTTTNSGSQTEPSNPAGGTATEPTVSNAVTEPTTTASGKSTDESKTYGENELRALLPTIDGFTKGDFDYSKHTHDTLDGRYSFPDGKQFVEVKLVDYKKIATAGNFVQMYHPGEDTVKFADLQAFITTSNFGYEHVDAAVGRFGLFVRGPSSRKDDVEKVAAAMIAAIK